MLNDTEEAQDVAQETFIRFWKVGDTSLPPPAVLGWLYKTSTRLAVDRLRHRRTAGHANEQLEATPAVNAGAPDAALAARHQLAALARTLSSEELEVAILHRADRMTQSEIATVTGRSDRTIRRMLVRVDEQLEQIARSAS